MGSCTLQECSTLNCQGQLFLHSEIVYVLKKGVGPRRYVCREARERVRNVLWLCILDACNSPWLFYYYLLILSTPAFNFLDCVYCYCSSIHMKAWSNLCCPRMKLVFIPPHYKQFVNLFSTPNLFHFNYNLPSLQLALSKLFSFSSHPSYTKIFFHHCS